MVSPSHTWPHHNNTLLTPRLALGGVTQTWPDQLIQHSITCSKRLKSQCSILLLMVMSTLSVCKLLCLLWQHKFSVSRQVSAAWRTALARDTRVFPGHQTVHAHLERATGRRKSDSALFKIASGIRRGDNCVKFLFLEQKLWYRLSRLTLVLFLAKGESGTHKKPMIRLALPMFAFSLLSAATVFMFQTTSERSL